MSGNQLSIASTALSAFFCSLARFCWSLVWLMGSGALMTLSRPPACAARPARLDSLLALMTLVSSYGHSGSGSGVGGALEVCSCLGRKMPLTCKMQYASQQDSAIIWFFTAF